MGDKYYAVDENIILKVLETNAKTGLNDLTIDKHRKVYGLNVLPKKKEDIMLVRNKIKIEERYKKIQNKNSN